MTFFKSPNEPMKWHSVVTGFITVPEINECNSYQYYKLISLFTVLHI